MIKAIAAMDDRQGLADDHGIPWQGQIPTEVRHFRDLTMGGVMLMGYPTYEEFEHPLPGRRSLVASRDKRQLRPGFELVSDALEFLKLATENIWVIGGAGLFASTIDLIDELHLTHLKGDFHCTKFFPPFKDDFELVDEAEPITENGITFTFCTYRRK